MIYVVIIFILSIVYIFYTITRKPRIPHGLTQFPIEKGLPIIGILHQIEGPLPFYFKRLTEKHGSTFRAMIGMKDVLVLNDYKMLRKTFLENGNKFSGRWPNQLFKITAHDSGIIFKDGEVWSKQRSFVLRVLRDFGLGKSRSFEIVESECMILLKELESLNNKEVDFSKIIRIYTANIILQFIMNKRFTRDDPKICSIDNIISESKNIKGRAQLVHLIFHICDFGNVWTKFILKITKLKEKIAIPHTIFKDEIDEHSKRLDFNSEGEDLIDRFLIEQHKLKEKTGSVDTFTDWQLIRNSFELFIAGNETTSTTLGWSMMFMARYPDIQNRVYDEIVNNIGTERLPIMNDKKSLNYTQAVMDEILRLSTVAPLAIFHRSLEDVSVDGYFIPGNTLIIPNVLACHTDPKIWKKPMEFYPEHFLLSDENGEEKYNCREELIPFGIGKRQCLGESLARMEYLIFFLSIIQRFKIQFVEEIDDERYKHVLIGENGFNRFCEISRFIFSKRW